VKIELSLDFLFHELDWASRIARCHYAGIEGIEFGNCSTHDMQLTKLLLKEYGVELVLLAGCYWVDEPVPHVRYSATDNHNHKFFFNEVQESLEFGRQCNARNMLLDTGDSIAGLDDDTMMKNCVEALGPAADKVVANGMKPVIEPLNRNDHKGIFLHGIDQAANLARQVGSNTKILVDIFHSTKEEKEELKDVLMRNSQYLAEIFHIADVPGRHEPGTGKVNWADVMQTLSSLGFSSWLGLEFVPSGGSEGSILASRSVLGI
jgi:hydroxypyruvate isomerase